MQLLINELAKEWNAAFLQALDSDPQFKALRASGKSEAFLKSDASLQVTQDRITKIGLYPYEQDKGRGATQNRSGGLWLGIYNWLAYKKYGIAYKDDKQRRSIAFAITKVISKSGSYKHRNPGARTDVYGRALAATLPQLLNKLGKLAQKEVLHGI